MADAIIVMADAIIVMAEAIIVTADAIIVTADAIIVTAESIIVMAERSNSLVFCIVLKRPNRFWVIPKSVCQVLNLIWIQKCTYIINPIF